MANSVMILHLWRTRDGVWAFDDATRGLRAEPFVGQTNRAIDRHAGGRNMVTILFSAGPIPGSQLRLDRISADAHGSWWTPSDGGEQCWLCPAMYHYFDSAPESIHVVFQAVDTAADRVALIEAVVRDPAQAAYALAHVHDLAPTERAVLEAAAKGVTV